MKQSFLALSTALVLTSCAGVHVTKTYIATGETEPKAIYIRPFTVSQAIVKGHHSNTAERPIRQSLAPAEFASDLQEELSKLAPAAVLKNNEAPKSGWLVEGEFEVLHAGSPITRSLSAVTSVGRSQIVLHVRVINVGQDGEASAGKETTSTQTSGRTAEGRIIYEFDLAGSSGATGKLGSITAPGLGYALPFDLRNAAERIAMVLTPDAHRYGVRTSPTIR